MADALGNISSADLLKLAGYKDAHDAATDEAGRKTASSAADALRDSLGMAQGAQGAGGLYSGTYTSQQLKDIVAARNARPVTSSAAPASAVTATRPTYRPASGMSDVTQITIDPEVYGDIYRNAVEGMYDLLDKRQGQTEQAYYRGLGSVQDTLIDTLGLESKGAIASGASRGMQSAQALSALLGFGQQGVEGVTGLAESRANLSQEEAAALAEAEKAAFTDSEMAKQAIAKFTTDLYGYDASNYAAELGLNSNFISSLFAKEAQTIASQTALEGQKLAAQTQIQSAQAYTAANGNPDKSDTDAWAAMYVGWENFSDDMKRAIQNAHYSGQPEDWKIARDYLSEFGAESNPNPGSPDVNWMPGSNDTTGINLWDPSNPNYIGDLLGQGGNTAASNVPIGMQLGVNLATKIPAIGAAAGIGASELLKMYANTQLSSINAIQSFAGKTKREFASELTSMVPSITDEAKEGWKDNKQKIIDTLYKLFTTEIYPDPLSN